MQSISLQNLEVCIFYSNNIFVCLMIETHSKVRILRIHPSHFDTDYQNLFVL